MVLEMVFWFGNQTTDKLLVLVFMFLGSNSVHTGLVDTYIDACFQNELILPQMSMQHRGQMVFY